MKEIHIILLVVGGIVTWAFIQIKVTWWFMTRADKRNEELRRQQKIIDERNKDIKTEKYLNGFFKRYDIDCEDLYGDQGELKRWVKDNPAQVKKFKKLVMKAREHIRREDRRIYKINCARWKKIAKVVKFFEKEKSHEAIPSWAIDYPKEDLAKAKSDYLAGVEYENTQRKLKLNAAQFLLKHKGYPANIHETSWEEYFVYKDLIRKNNRQLLGIISECKGEIMELPDSSDYKAFYLASELTAEDREKLLSLGYRLVPFIFISTGKSGNNLIIKNNPNKESDYHFCLKHLFAREFDGVIESQRGDLRFDVEIEIDNNPVYLEIETGTNKDKTLLEKADAIRRITNKYLIICSRENKVKYRKYFDSSRLFTVTEAFRELGGA